MKVTLSILFLLLTNSYVDCSNDTALWDLIRDALEFLISEVDFDPDVGQDINGYTSRHNYTLLNYTITTDDGYILTVHRIPYGRNVTEEEKSIERPAVLLAHGMAASSMDWVWQGNNSLALLLADEGYDVWLYNARGTMHSLRHTNLTSANSSYWDFSFHEKGYYDMAATIDCVRNHTKWENISYVGHSQGTSDIMALTSSRPEYNDYLNVAVLLSPIAYMTHMAGPIVKFVEENLSVIVNLLHTIGIYGVPYSKYLSYFGALICDDSSSLQGLCIIFMGSLCGFDQAQVDTSKLPLFLSNAPAGLSIKDMDHYLQEMKSGYFRQYDYGATNVIHYGSLTPPSYNISAISAPLAIYYAENDFLAAVEDVEKLISELSYDPVVKKKIEYKYFSHLDFVTAKDVKALLYDDVISTIKKMNPLV